MDEDDQLVTVYETTQPVVLGMVKSAFDQAGIPYSTVNDVVSTVYPVDGMVIVGFQVFRRDVEHALEVLRQLGLDVSDH